MHYATDFGIDGLEQELHATGPVYLVPPATDGELVRVETDQVQGRGCRLEQAPIALEVIALIVFSVLVLVYFYIYKPVVNLHHEFDAAIKPLCPVEPDHDLALGP